MEFVKKIFIPSELSTKLVHYCVHHIYQGKVWVEISEEITDTDQPLYEEDLHAGASKLGLKLMKGAFKVMKTIPKSQCNLTIGEKQCGSDKERSNSNESTNSILQNKNHVGFHLENFDVNFSASEGRDCDNTNENNLLEYACDFCKKRCDTLRTLKIHEKAHHDESPPSLNSESCGKLFRQRATLDEHAKIHRDVISRLDFGEPKHCKRTLTQYRRKNTYAKRTSCSICKKSFTNEYVMQLHMRTHTGDELYCCATCGKKFPYKSSLNTHSLIHTGKKPYICSVCGKSFTQKIHAKEHELQHSEKKRYSCTECKKTFAHKSGLDRHVSDIHHKNRPYVCETCGKLFPRKTKLIEHTRIHTGEKPYVCGVCGVSYKSNRSLKNHRRSRHESNSTHSEIRFAHKPYLDGIMLQPNVSSQNSWSDSGTDASNANSSADVQFPSALLPLTIQHLDKDDKSTVSKILVYRKTIEVITEIISKSPPVYRNIVTEFMK